MIPRVVSPLPDSQLPVMTSPTATPTDQNASPISCLFLVGVHERDLLQISLTVNACLLLQAPIGKLLGYLVCKYGRRRFNSLISVIQEHPFLIGRLLMEIGVLVVILLLTIHQTFHTDIRPFTRDPTLPMNTRLRLVFSLTIGRFLVIAANILLLKDSNGIRTLTGHSGKASFDFVYCVVSIVSNAISLGYGENHLLVLTSSFLEVNCIHLSLWRLRNLLRQHSSSPITSSTASSRPSLKTILLFGIVCSVTRIVLPILFLGLAVSKESPFRMTTVPFVWFALCCIFYGVFHVYLLYQCVQQVVEALSYPISSLLTTRPSPSNSMSAQDNYRPAFAIQNASEFYPNNLHATGIDPGKSLAETKFSNPPNWPAAHWTKTANGVRYGFLRCYDNRNLCSSHTNPNLNGKVNNIGCKDSYAKEDLLCYNTSTRTMGLTNQNVEHIEVAEGESNNNNGDMAEGGDVSEEEEAGSLLGDSNHVDLENCCCGEYYAASNHCTNSSDNKSLTLGMEQVENSDNSDSQLDYPSRVEGCDGNDRGGCLPERDQLNPPFMSDIQTCSSINTPFLSDIQTCSNINPPFVSDTQTCSNINPPFRSDTQTCSSINTPFLSDTQTCSSINPPFRSDIQTYCSIRSRSNSMSSLKHETDPDVEIHNGGPIPDVS